MGKNTRKNRKLRENETFLKMALVRDGEAPPPLPSHLTDPFDVGPDPGNEEDENGGIGARDVWPPP